MIGLGWSMNNLEMPFLQFHRQKIGEPKRLMEKPKILGLVAGNEAVWWGGITNPHQAAIGFRAHCEFLGGSLHY